MQYYRCKCGNTTMVGSYGPDQCQSCDKCGSDLAQGPSEHREPLPHDFSHVSKVDTDQGEMTITRCRYCHKTKSEIG